MTLPPNVRIMFEVLEVRHPSHRWPMRYGVVLRRRPIDREDLWKLPLETGIWHVLLEEGEEEVRSTSQQKGPAGSEKNKKDDTFQRDVASVL